LWIQKVSVFDFSTKTPRGSSSLDLSSTCISCCQWNQTLPGAAGGNGAGFEDLSLGFVDLSES
jgi:hypothetical protein